MATRKKRLSEGEDDVTEFLLNQIAKHVIYEQLGVFARDLEISDTDYGLITSPNCFSINELRFRVSMENNRYQTFYRPQTKTETPSDRDPPGQKHSHTETPPIQRHHTWTETLLDRDTH